MASRRWNRENPDAVRKAQRRYAEKKKQRRSKLSPYQNAKEDLRLLLKRIPRKRERRLILEWALANLLDDQG